MIWPVGVIGGFNKSLVPVLARLTFCSMFGIHAHRPSSGSSSRVTPFRSVRSQQGLISADKERILARPHPPLVCQGGARGRGPWGLGPPAHQFFSPKNQIFFSLHFLVAILVKYPDKQPSTDYTRSCSMQGKVPTRPQLAPRAGISCCCLSRSWVRAHGARTVLSGSRKPTSDPTPRRHPPMGQHLCDAPSVTPVSSRRNSAAATKLGTRPPPGLFHAAAVAGPWARRRTPTSSRFELARDERRAYVAWRGTAERAAPEKSPAQSRTRLALVEVRRPLAIMGGR